MPSLLSFRFGMSANCIFLSAVNIWLADACLAMPDVQLLSATSMKGLANATWLWYQAVLHRTKDKPLVINLESLKAGTLLACRQHMSVKSTISVCM